MNRAPPPGASSTETLAVHPGDELGDDRQPDADPSGLQHGVAGAAVEAREHPLPLLGRHARPLVADLDERRRAPTAERHPDRGAGRRELHRVGEQVRGDALEAAAIAVHRRVAWMSHHHLVLAEGRGEPVDDPTHHLADVERLQGHRQRAAVEQREVEEILHDGAERPGVGGDAPHEVEALLLGEAVPAGGQEPGEPGDGGRRRPQLVRRGAEEHGLEAVELAQPAEGFLLAGVAATRSPSRP